MHLAACRGFEDADNSTVARQSAERNSQKRPAVRAASPEERTADTHHVLRVELEAVPPERVAAAPRSRRNRSIPALPVGAWFTGRLAAVEPREDDQVARAVVVEVGAAAMDSIRSYALVSGAWAAPIVVGPRHRRAA